MAFIHGKLTGVLINQFNMSPYLNEVSSPGEVDASETSTFGVNNKTYIPGLGDASVSLKGLFDNTADSGSAAVLGGIHDVALSDGTNAQITYGLGGLVDGNRCVMAEGVLSKYELSSAVADVNELSAELQADGGVDYGIILDGLQSVATATTTNGTAVDNTDATENGGVGTLHVTANAQTSWTDAHVQHSVDNGVWVDLISFSRVASGLAYERVAVTGTVNRYLRASIITNGTGAVTYTVAFARR